MIRTIAVRRLLLLAGLVVLSAGLVASRSPAATASPSTSPSAATDALRVGLIMDVDSLNPFVATNVTSNLIISLNYDVLVGLDPVTLKPSRGQDASGLATDWTTSADGTTWTFNLRRDATWQDGRGPVTARDVAFTYSDIIDNEMAAFTSYTQGITSVRALDDDTVRFVCDRPKADLLTSAGAIPILPEHIWSGVSPKAAATSYPNRPPIVGSGPFQCVAVKKNGYATMVANKAYWRSSPKIDKILFEYYTNRDSMAWDLQAGAIDACYQPSYEQERKLEKDPSITARTFVVNGYDDLVMNSYEGRESLGNPVLRDPRFRQALQWAVDRDKLVQLVYEGTGVPGDTVIPGGYSADPDWHWTPPASETYTFDLEKARQLLDAAGYRDADGDGVRESRGKPITLRVWSMSEYPTSRAEVKLVCDWFEQLSLKIDQATIPMGAMYDRIFNMKDGELAPDFDICQSGFYLGPDPGQSLSFFTTGQLGTWNDSGFSDPEFDSLWREQARTLDTGQRKQLVDRMQQIVYEQSPYIVLAYFGDGEAWRNEWTGWVASPPDVGSAVRTVDSYLFVHRAAAGTTAAQESGRSRWLVPLALVGVAAVAGGGAILARRKRRAEEE
jgi:peptide/nickel transport system substrate-binding protein